LRRAGLHPGHSREVRGQDRPQRTPGDHETAGIVQGFSHQYRFTARNQFRVPNWTNTSSLYVHTSISRAVKHCGPFPLAQLGVTAKSAGSSWNTRKRKTPTNDRAMAVILPLLLPMSVGEAEVGRVVGVRPADAVVEGNSVVLVLREDDGPVDRRDARDIRPG